MKLKIQSKLLIYILSTIVLIFLISYGYLIFNVNSITVKNAISHTDDIANKSSMYFEQLLNTDVEIVRTVKNSVYNFDKLQETQREELVGDMIPNIMRQASQFISLSSVWELSAIDSTYHKPYGRVRYIYYWDEGSIKLKKDFKNLEGDDLGSLYFSLKTNETEAITDPYYDSYSGLEEDKVLMSSIAVPIVNNGYKGMIVADIALERFNQMVTEIKPFTNSLAFLISNDGYFITFSEKKYINTKIDDYYKEDAIKNKIIEKIKFGENFSYFFTDSLNVDYYITYSPIDIGGFGTYWSLALVVPIDYIKAESQSIVYIAIFVGLLGVLFLTLIIWLIARNISKPLEKTTFVLGKLSQGEINTDLKIQVNSQDEIGNIAESVNLLIDGLNNTAKFSFEIGKGNLDAELVLRSKDDIIGKALLEMRESLKYANKEELKRKEEDVKQNWSTLGETIFGEILRERSENIEEFSYKIISNLVKYISANQGGLFIINDDNKNDIFLELTASYAFDRKKSIQKKINIGIGLVGRCYQEAETIYMNDVPNDYVNITSGLGEENPKHILIVPFKFNEEIYAVAELASFNKFEKHQIDFVEKVGVSIASTVGSVKINVRTARLVEELKVQSEELSSQEEEMRQNMEEMQATQEELSKKAIEYGSIIDAINQISLVAEYDMNGKLIHINDKFLRFLGKSADEMLGKYQGSFSANTEQLEEFDLLWADLNNGKTKTINQHVKIKNRDYWFSESYTPIFNEFNKPYKVLNICVDITKSILAQKEIDTKFIY